MPAGDRRRRHRLRRRAADRDRASRGRRAAAARPHSACSRSACAPSSSISPSTAALRALPVAAADRLERARQRRRARVVGVVHDRDAARAAGAARRGARPAAAPRPGRRCRQAGRRAPAPPRSPRGRWRGCPSRAAASGSARCRARVRIVGGRAVEPERLDAARLDVRRGLDSERDHAAGEGCRRAT